MTTRALSCRTIVGTTSSQGGEPDLLAAPLVGLPRWVGTFERVRHGQHCRPTGLPR
ncbi:hypothetical protein [Micromonospora sp. NPDC005173]|uniref:hypothetical protein n=1 Tax=Micromonospora sp. NPDC005173 TaxID=3157165 RepID=UPI0033A0F8C4